MTKLNVLVFIGFMSLFLAGSIYAGDQRAQEPNMAPLNPDFCKYSEGVRNGEYRLFTGEGHPLGYIPTPVDLSHTRSEVGNKMRHTGYPATYDLRTINKVTPVKDQGECNDCWTFAALASLESYLKPGETWDFSEQHLNANHGFDNPECGGGNNSMATAYLARWDGPIRETDVPYPYDLSGSSAYSPVKHVQQVIFLPERTGPTDNDTIKSFITKYGALSCALYYDDDYYNSTTYSYYCNGSFSGNHSVALVGWNDNYSKSKFKSTPPGDGAFIIKNSWGTGWGENGYFYLSYYDATLESNSFADFNNAESANNYDKNYQYDPLGWTNSCGFPGSKTAWGANIFTTTDNKPLQAVGFYTTDINVNYTIYIYRDCQAGKPQGGTLAVTKSGTESYPGYHTVKLDSPVSLSKGQNFSVVIKFVNSSYNYPVAVEEPIDNYTSSASANIGESFMDDNGSDPWYDMGQSNFNRNVCIKAFTGGGSIGDPLISVSRDRLNFGCISGDSVTTAQSFIISNEGTGSLNWSLSSDSNWLDCSTTAGTDSGVVMVSIKNTSLPAGSYIASLNITDPLASNSPQMVSVYLTVLGVKQSQPPFGDFATPLDGSTVSSSIAVTGWVLDDVEVMGVKIYNGSNFVGDAVFVEGARPDVEQAYPGYPKNYLAGWGYMMLTNFLPNGGNGNYTIYAIATDAEGNTVTLGSKNITCDNAHAVKPFGAIDTPTQGGSASGSSFINWGWVLTPQPNSIPTNGSTINVYVDGVNLGHPSYNNYRPDIAGFFPGYANSNGAAGYFYLDTTGYENGVHTIQWTATDSGGNTDGIGSRYFTIQNTGSSASQSQNTSQIVHFTGDINLTWLPVDHYEHIGVKTGYDKFKKLQEIYPDDNGYLNVQVKEIDRVEIHFSIPISNISPLPVGAALDAQKGVFYWGLGPGFLGDYELIFVDARGFVRKVNITVTPE